MERDTEVTVKIPEGFQLPEKGVLEGSVLISTDAQAGPVKRSPMEFDPIGSFTSTPSLDVSVYRAGELSDLVVRFRASMTLERYDMISLKLPGFSGPRKDFTLDAVSPHAELFYGGSWSDSNEVMQLTVRNRILANVSVSLMVLKLSLIHI